MLPEALKSCPKSNKLPNLVTLVMREKRFGQPDEEVDDKEDGQREVDLNGNGVLPVDARLLLEVMRV